MAMLDILITASKTGGSIDDVGIREEVDTFVFEVNLFISLKFLGLISPLGNSA